MPICFVIQPFDGGDYDKRYHETFEPAIKAAGLKPYRVDKDPSVEIVIQEIERGIREADVCFAEISEDRPNVWYEVGYAFANRKPVCMVCTTKRKKFPFDIQHRLVLRYKTGATSDFKKLEVEITERLRALAAKRTPKATSLIVRPSASAVPSPQLAIEYDKKQHYTRHPNGDVEVRLTVRNVGNARAKRVRVKLDSLIPKTNVDVASPFSTQFNSLTLQVTRNEPGFSINPDDSVEVRSLIRAKRDADWFFIDGYNLDNQRDSFRTPAARYELTVIASSHDGGATKRRFVAFQDKRGELDFGPKR